MADLQVRKKTITEDKMNDMGGMFGDYAGGLLEVSEEAASNKDLD